MSHGFTPINRPQTNSGHSADNSPTASYSMTGYLAPIDAPQIIMTRGFTPINRPQIDSSHSVGNSATASSSVADDFTPIDVPLVSTSSGFNPINRPRFASGPTQHSIDTSNTPSRTPSPAQHTSWLNTVLTAPQSPIVSTSTHKECNRCRKYHPPDSFVGQGGYTRKSCAACAARYAKYSRVAHMKKKKAAAAADALQDNLDVLLSGTMVDMTVETGSVGSASMDSSE